ncbi:glutathione S-transferase family protein [Cedecea lapagei]|uniref:glutathione S-transferase family protein n=1 Tax=Cedecea lapagei TaxID=158823 RepID=UPI001BD0E6DF|nr:glutathione S-transferase [Cedecea lapagei]
MKIYQHPLSGHSHRVVLFASLLGLKAELVEVDLMAGEHKQPAFLALNAFGQVPVLDDSGVVISDSNAILIYLAKQYGKNGWLPEDARGAAEVQRWLSVAAGEIAYGPAAARLITVFGAGFNADEVITRAHDLLTKMEAHLTHREWLAADRPTIADIAVYSYIARAPEGNVNIAGYPAVRRLLSRVEALPGFVPFVQTPAGLSAQA